MKIQSENHIILTSNQKPDDKDYYNNEVYDEERFYSSRRQKRLFRLRELQGYEINSIDPDIRGWDVETQDGKKIGTVYELIVDPQAKKLRYVEVASMGDRGAADEDQHLLLPVGITSIDQQDDKLVVKMGYNDLTRYPLYRGGEITRKYEDSLRNSIRMDSLTSRDPDDEYYNNEYYNEEGFYGKRGSGVRWI
jgi:photosynthetic reaction center H subunit